jgi:Mor family transcriptional regulator
MSTLPSADPDALDVIEEEARAIAQFFGVKQCEVAAEMLVGRIAKRLGGRRVYVASDRRDRAEQKDRIRKKFNGRNVTELAADEGLSVRQVQRIVYKRIAPEK